MGMFDYYRPKPEIACPVCAVSGLEWQGKQGPCALFVWEQGQAGPVDQIMDDDWKISLQQRTEHRLPARFELYARCHCSTFLTAVGFTQEGLWARTELLSPDNAVAYADESEREFRNRLAAIARHPGHTG